LKRCERKDEKDLHATARRRRKARSKLGDIEDVVSIAIDCGFRLHKDLGPGVLESVYEALLAERLRRRGLLVERQKPLPILFDGIALPREGLRRIANGVADRDHS
jgi:hypothetical protein